MMFSENGGRPGDQRGILHKSKFGKFLGGAVKTLVPAVGVGSRIVSTASSIFLKPRARATIPRTLTARPTLAGQQGKELGKQLKVAGFGGIPSGARGITGGRAGPCDWPMVLDSAGRCRTPTSGEFGGEQFGVGEAVMGRYGAALEPGSQIIDRAICLRGMQLGDDGLCYNKSQITNKQRMWPAGRKPLLSGGDMRAISIAARAGRRLEGTTKRLQRLGMMKKPASRRALPPHRHAQASTAVVSVP